VPALVFGIPGDTITAVVIGVLYVKGMNPGPTLFLFNPQNIYAIFIIFILANIIMIPLGWAAMKIGKQILRVPRAVLMPCILAFCIVGAFATNNAIFNVVVMLIFGVLGFFMERTKSRSPPAFWALSGRDAGGQLRDLHDQGRRKPARLFRPPDRGGPRRLHDPGLGLAPHPARAESAAGAAAGSVTVRSWEALPQEQRLAPAGRVRLYDLQLGGATNAARVGRALILPSGASRAANRSARGPYRLIPIYLTPVVMRRLLRAKAA
jgi:hypothetical protein